MALVARGVCILTYKDVCLDINKIWAMACFMVDPIREDRSGKLGQVVNRQTPHNSSPVPANAVGNNFSGQEEDWDSGSHYWGGGEGNNFLLALPSH